MGPFLRLIFVSAVIVASFGESRGGELETQPISELPFHIRFKEGELGLFADYAAARVGFVPTYLVNAGEIPLPFVRGVSVLLRQVRGNDGTWFACDRLPEPPSEL